MTKKQRKNAETIVALSRSFGHLEFNEHGQTIDATLNLSIPCAHLVVAGVVTGVADTNDGINDNAVEDVREYCKRAVELARKRHGAGWWDEEAAKLDLFA